MMVPAADFESLLPPKSLAEIKRIELRTKRTLTTPLIGQYRSAFRGTGLIFNELREYMPGDDVKHIHWKVTARSGKVYVKSYEEDRELNIMLALDISRSTIAGTGRSKHQKGLEFCALISMLAKVNHDSLGLCLFSDTIYTLLPVSRSRTQLKRILRELLLERELPQATDLQNVVRDLSQKLKRSSIIFLISDFFSPITADDLRLLSGKHDVICVMLDDTLYEELPYAGLVEFVDAESGETILIDTSNKRARAALAAANSARHASCQDICTAAGADFMSIDQSPLQPLINLMTKRNQRIR